MDLKLEKWSTFKVNNSLSIKATNFQLVSKLAACPEVFLAKIWLALPKRSWHGGLPTKMYDFLHFYTFWHTTPKQTWTEGCVGM